MWAWLDDHYYSWHFVRRVLIKSLFLFNLVNLIFILIPNSAIAKLSVYNHILPGRERFPFTNNDIALSYNIMIGDLDYLFESHVISSPGTDTFKVVILGDSATWGYGLDANEMYTSQANRIVEDSNVRFYNLAYPYPSVFKDMLLLSYAERYNPDLIIWFVTPLALHPSQQYGHIIVDKNLEYALSYIEQYDSNFFILDHSWAHPINRTLMGRRRDLAEFLQLQLLAVPWAVAKIDHPTNPPAGELPTPDNPLAWENYHAPVELSQDDLDLIWLDVAGELTDAPLVIVNQPIQKPHDVSDRYNVFYPVWAYDQSVELMEQFVAENGWQYHNWDDVVSFEGFTDTPLHVSVESAQIISRLLVEVVCEYYDG